MRLRYWDKCLAALFLLVFPFGWHSAMAEDRPIWWLAIGYASYACTVTAVLHRCSELESEEH